MFIDLLLLCIFLVVAGVGFFQGTIKLLIAIITFYASTVLASLYFKFLALAMVQRGTSSIVADAISFFLILAICFAILLAAALYTFRYVKLPGQLDFVDRVFGLTLGLVLGVLASSVVAMVLQFLFISHSAGNPYPLTRWLQSSTQGSQMLPLLMGNILPRLFTAVSPFLPEAALQFFNPNGRF